MKKILVLAAALCLALCVFGAGCVDNDEPSGGGGASSGEELDVKVGDSFTIGTYNGKALEWDVLAVDKKNEKALLITKDCIGYVRFHDTQPPEDLTWETSTLRAWLAGEFADAAFSNAEKADILTVVNSNPPNSENGVFAGDSTEDTVFVLSESEMRQYYPNPEDMAAFYNGEGVSYWTRTPGDNQQGYICTYSGGGDLYMTGNFAISDAVCVRPAFWLDLSADEEE